MKIVIIDGQGGRMGGLLAEKIKKAAIPGAEIYALGTNSAATTAMLKAGASTKDKEAQTLISADAKEFILGEDKLVIAQINTVDAKEVVERQIELTDAINKEISKRGLSAFVFVITNILTSNSEVFVLGDKKDKVANAFGKVLTNDLMTLEGVVSRKKQVVPQITEEFMK